MENNKCLNEKCHSPLGNGEHYCPYCEDKLREICADAKISAGEKQKIQKYFAKKGKDEIAVLNIQHDLNEILEREFPDVFQEPPPVKPLLVENRITFSDR